jgi:dienelactone hydrolase
MLLPRLLTLVLAATLLAPAVSPPVLYGQRVADVAQSSAAETFIPEHPLTGLRTLDSYFPMRPATDLPSWLDRRQKLRRHVQVSAGLWPMPRRTPLQPVIHGRLDMGEYTIEKVCFESFPGFLVTGNLYRPANHDGRCPGVLCPHGHFREGRFRWATDAELAADRKSGAEKFETNGRSPLQARCANLAMLGCVVFHYDMLGYADSQQITHDLAHGFRSQREDMNRKDGWGFFSPQAELRLQSIMGLQTWNSIRSLDFLCSLPDVDATRIGVTGGSGGGTQTFILCAIDPRPAVAFPAVMVSTAMQGGCTCENCCHLRINAGNVDFAALFAPKPMGLTAADDWTREMESKGFPELLKTWQLFDAQRPAPVQLTARLEFGHNYNQVGREAMYDFFNRHLIKGQQDTRERQIVVHRADTLTVFDEKHPRPDWSPRHEQELLKDWEASSRLIVSPNDLRYEDQLLAFQESMQVALASILSHPASRLAFREEASELVQLAGGVAIQAARGWLSASDVSLDSQIQILGTAETPPSSIDHVVLNLTRRTPEQVRQSLVDNDGYTGWLGEKRTIICEIRPCDFGQDANSVRNRLVANGREAAGYTFGYNRSVFAWRVSQLLYACQYLKSRFPNATFTIRADEPREAPAAAIAFAASDHCVSRFEGQLNGFRFVSVDSLQDEHFWPGAVKYGDVMAFLAMRPEGQFVLGGETTGSTALLAAAIQAAGRGGQLKLTSSVGKHVAE